LFLTFYQTSEPSPESRQWGGFTIVWGCLRWWRGDWHSNL